MDQSGVYETVWYLERDKAPDLWEIGQVNITGRDVIISAEKDPAVNSGFAGVDEFYFTRNIDLCETIPSSAGLPTTTTTTPAPHSGRWQVHIKDSIISSSLRIPRL